MLFLFKGIFFLISVVLNEYIDTEKVKNIYAPSDCLGITPCFGFGFFVIWVTEKGSHAPKGEEG